MSRLENLVVLFRNNERFEFWFDSDPDSEVALLRLLGKMAADADDSFTWFDAAVCARSVRNLLNSDDTR